MGTAAGLCCRTEGKKRGTEVREQRRGKGASVCSFWQSCAAVFSLASQVWCGRNKYALTAGTFKPQHFQFSLEFNLRRQRKKKKYFIIAVFLVDECSQLCQETFRHMSGSLYSFQYSFLQIRTGEPPTYLQLCSKGSRKK